MMKKSFHSQIKQKIIKILPLFFAGFIGFFSLLPLEKAISSSFYDKFDHFIAYAILAITTKIAWPLRDNFHIILIVCFYGAIIELCQNFSPGRNPDFLDMLANAFGAISGVVSVIMMKKRIKKID